jgi:hypothetical protein
VFVAVPVSLLGWVLARELGHGRLGIAFGLAYLLHLPGDVLYGTVTAGSRPALEAVLWPVASRPPGGDPAGFLGETLYYLGRYGEFVSRPEAAGYLLAEAVLLLSALGLWLRDGRPGCASLHRWLDDGSGRH